MSWFLIWLVTCAVAVWMHYQWKRRFYQAKSQAEKKMADLVREQYRYASQTLAEKEALFNSMVEGVLVLEPDGRVSLANRAAGALFKIPADLAGKTMLEVVRVHELADAVKCLSNEKRSLSLEVRLPGLEERIFEVNAAAIFDRDGQNKGAILVFHDVSRVKKLEKTRQEFVANVSHELRTPLALIKGYVETLMEGAKDDPETQNRFLQRIERNTTRLTLIIEDLLTISRLESGNIALKFGKVNLRTAVERVIEDFQKPAEARGVKLENCVPESLETWADGNRLAQVLSNLVDNAIKYGRAEGWVTIEATLTPENWIEVVVRDDGPGIPPEAVGRVFERFYRVDKARSRGAGRDGTWLGHSETHCPIPRRKGMGS